MHYPNPAIWLHLLRSAQSVWVMFYFGLGDATDGHAEILVAFSTDLVRVYIAQMELMVFKALKNSVYALIIRVTL